MEEKKLCRSLQGRPVNIKWTKNQLLFESSSLKSLIDISSNNDYITADTVFELVRNQKKKKLMPFFVKELEFYLKDFCSWKIEHFQKLDQKEKKLRSHFGYNYTYWLVFSIPFILGITGVILESIDFNVRPEFWFGAAGSIVTAISVIFEFTEDYVGTRVEEYISKMLSSEAYFGLPLYSDVYLGNKLYFESKNLKYKKHALVIWGTLVWGYGEATWLLLFT